MGNSERKTDLNILSFDIEEWYIEKVFKAGDPQKYRAFEDMLHRILDILTYNEIKATFFCLGGLAIEFPHIVKLISSKGHEIGCHSHSHRWINKMTPDEFLKDTQQAMAALEDCIGKKIKSFRAPAFSIGESNKWALEILADCGIENDSSIFPGLRDFGGFPSFQKSNDEPCEIIINQKRINEFPIGLTKIPVVNKKIAYSGGGYFRLLPLSFVKETMKKSRYTMCYFHIADLLDFKSNLLSKEEYERYFKERGTLKNRLVRYLKSNLGRKRAFNGLGELIRDFNFISVEEAAREISNLPIVRL